MIIGPIKNIFSFSLSSDKSTDNFVLEVEEVLKTLPEGTIIITDLFGGTSSNVAAILSKKYKAYVVSGLSISMLIAADELRIKYQGAELIDKIIAKSVNDCKNIGQLMEK